MSVISVNEKDILLRSILLFQIVVIIKKTLDLMGRGFLKRFALNDN